MPTVELTDEEWALVQRKRDEAAAIRAKTAVVVAAIKTVSDYATYLYTNNVQDTYDVFVTGFGYSGPKPQKTHALCVRAFDIARSAVEAA